MRHNPDTTGRTPPKGLVVYHYYEGDDDPQMDRWAKKAWDIALASPIRIKRDRELTAIAVLGKKVVGGGWSATSYPSSDDDEGEFTFDIVVAPEAQRKGVGDALVEEMLKQFRDVATMGDMDFVLNIEVVNPAMERILARRGFTRRGEDDPRASHGDVMMTRRNGGPVPRRNGGPVPRRNRRNPEGGSALTYSEADLARALARDKNLKKANLKGADLKGVDLTGANLASANLSGANLEGAKISAADFFGANLEGANLAGANLKGSDFGLGNLSGVNLAGANLERANFVKVTLNGADLAGANLTGANLERANLDGAILNGANISDANLTGANLTGANLDEAILSATTLCGAVFDKASLIGAELDGARMEPYVLRGRTSFRGADLAGANLKGAIVQEVDFTGANLTGANATHLRGLGRFGADSVEFDGASLRYADLTGSHFRDSSFVNVDFTRADLREVVFNSTDLRDADFTGADLYRTRFNLCERKGALGLPAERLKAVLAGESRESLRGLDFSNLELDGVDLSGRDLEGANFADASLATTSFRGASLDGCDFSKAYVTGADFTSTTLRATNFTSVQAERADFSETFCGGTDFTGAKMAVAQFKNAEMTSADLTGASVTEVDFTGTTFQGVKAVGAYFNRAILRNVEITSSKLDYATFKGADLTGSRIAYTSVERADFTDAKMEDTVFDDVDLSSATMPKPFRERLFQKAHGYGRMSGPILKMDKPDAPTKAAEFKKKYPREAERLKADTQGRDLVPAVKEAVRAKYRSPRPWVLTRGKYTGSMQRYCGGPNEVVKFNIDLLDSDLTPSQQGRLRQLAETSRRSGHPHETDDLFTIGWVRYCEDNANETWLVEEVQSDVSIVRQKLKEQDFPEDFREVVEILGPIADRFYHDALSIIFEMAAEKGYAVEMLDYPAKREFGSPKSVYTDLPREMGMQKQAKSALEGEAVYGVGEVWYYKPNPARLSARRSSRRRNPTRSRR
jgi:uncharacterized protein YjbI with pentapeptide repeats/RimJ/RimL family protein N-acetyltransferase